MQRIGVVTVALAAVLAVGCNKADNSTSRASDGSAVGTAGKADSNVKGGDRDFVRDVAQANMAEIDVAKLAAERSPSADVKKFAQMMVDDHNSAGDKLTALAAQHNIDVPAQVADKDKDLREKLNGKQGLDFDREYADAMVDRHQDLVDKLESRIDKQTLSRATTDADHAPGANDTDAKVKATTAMPEKSDNPVTMAINQWAADTYPVAYAHLQAAKALRDGVKKRSTN